ncbi:putative PurR-regulated permease PerM [Streptosporangium becharense]|uniref:Putative PurR-regulated permease PerM n=1 Tax=Streptosporangium becharense TaxID=1816182 RepID=A0A7W9MFS0_9ACTN|nr:AI-2E family transporter [Streptosporangium becharense]MBB2909960.1 putative PurR-regulated permease PerM [Streptosporangium becharense]MBB5819085.1 putative PurR-regulated permease PerM [Streptosporangium becharense]
MSDASPVSDDPENPALHSPAEPAGTARRIPDGRPEDPAPSPDVPELLDEILTTARASRQPGGPPREAQRASGPPREAQRPGDSPPKTRDADGPPLKARDADGPARMRREDGEPYGQPGKPLARSPFMVGLTAGMGLLTAWALSQALVTVRSVIVLIVVAMFLAFGLNPAVETLQRRRVPRRGAISVVFGGVILFFVLFGLAIVPPVSQEAASFVSAVPGYVQELLANPTLKQLDTDYQILTRIGDYITSGGLAQAVAGGLVGAGAVVFNAFFSGVTLLVLTLYFLGSLPSIKDYLFALVPNSRRARTRALGDEIINGIGGYVAGNLLISVIAGVVTWVFLAVLDVDYALALALVVAVTDLVPLVGATIGAVLVTVVALLQSGTLGIACGIFFLIYQQIENYLVYPRVMKHSVDVTPAVTVIAALFGGTLLGIVGALLAIPVAAALALIIREVVIPRQARL